MTPQPVVMLVEDDDADALLVEQALGAAGGEVRLQRFRTGDAALAHLAAVALGTEPRPALVLLDLNLPGTPGMQVLERCKGDERLLRIPVTVLSTSDHPGHVAAVYAAHGNAYVTKPVLLDDFLERVGRLRRFWLDTAVQVG